MLGLPRPPLSPNPPQPPQSPRKRWHVRDGHWTPLPRREGSLWFAVGGGAAAPARGRAFATMLNATQPCVLGSRGGAAVVEIGDRGKPLLDSPAGQPSRPPAKRGRCGGCPRMTPGPPVPPKRRSHRRQARRGFGWRDQKRVRGRGWASAAPRGASRLGQGLRWWLSHGAVVALPGRAPRAGCGPALRAFLSRDDRRVGRGQMSDSATFVPP